VTEKELNDHIKHVRNLATYYYGWRNVLRDDLVGYGMLGLAKAIQRYNPTRDIPFRNYMVMQVIHEMQSGLRTMDMLDRGSRRKARKGEFAFRFKDIELEIITHPMYHPTVVNRLLEQEIRIAVREAVSQLPVKECVIMTMYLDGYTLKQIGRILDVSEGRISQIMRATVCKLRGLLSHLYIELRGGVRPKGGDALATLS